MKITISKKQWEEIGKKAGWVKTAMNEEDIMLEQIKVYPQEAILKAIHSLKTDGISGFETVPLDEVYSVLEICDAEELNSILSFLEKNKEIK